VPNRSRVLTDAEQRLSRALIDVCAELRGARLARGLSQAAVARALGVDRSKISRVENQRVARLTLAAVWRHAAVVGLRPSIKLYPTGSSLRDAAQVRYIAMFVERIKHAWVVRLDVPLPRPGDLRAVDVLLTGTCTIAVEVVTRLFDLQAALRAAQLKQRDIGAARLIIVIAATASNRRVLEDARATLLSTFDLDTRRTMAKLANGEDPGRDAIVVIG
jgi:transcriptional regulator with XRE-family HTH domain